jgi:hypothetical protein
VIGLLRAETTKLVKRWLYWVMILILGAVMVLLAVLFVVLPRFAPDAIPELPAIGKPEIYLFGVTQALDQTWFPLILATVLLGGEVSSPVWAGALTRESRRWMHLLAKVGLITAAAWMAMMLAVVGWVVVSALVVEGSGSLPLGTWGEILWKALLSELTWVGLGLGAAALIRSTGLAIGATLAFSFGEGILALWRPFREISLSSAGQSLLGDLGIDVSGGIGIGFFELMPVGQAVAVTAGWGLVGMILAYVGLELRDA